MKWSTWPHGGWSHERTTHYSKTGQWQDGTFFHPAAATHIHTCTSKYPAVISQSIPVAHQMMRILKQRRLFGSWVEVGRLMKYQEDKELNNSWCTTNHQQVTQRRGELCLAACLLAWLDGGVMMATCVCASVCLSVCLSCVGFRPPFCRCGRSVSPHQPASSSVCLLLPDTYNTSAYCHHNPCLSLSLSHSLPSPLQNAPNCYFFKNQ